MHLHTVERHTNGSSFGESRRCETVSSNVEHNGCKYDLTTTADDMAREYLVDIKDEDLDEIVEIISEGMVVQWLRQFVNNQENLSLALNTRDFTTYSSAELLNRVNGTYTEARKNFINAMREYSYNHGDLTELHL